VIGQHSCYWTVEPVLDDGRTDPHKAQFLRPPEFGGVKRIKIGMEGTMQYEVGGNMGLYYFYPKGVKIPGGGK
jgi:hypothetical protein